ncbi:MAG: type secretion system contractile sheath large subunit, partial [Pseudomonadota bacterium]
MADNQDTQTENLELLDRIISEGGMANEPSQVGYAKVMLGTLATELLDEGMTFSPDKGLVATINERVAQIDQILTDQLNAIMHHPDFQALEASWQGLKDLVFGSETSGRLKIRLMVASKKELLTDLESAVDYDMSVLFKKVYEEEYGTFGGNPFSMLLGDYYFGRHPQDVALLERISKVAAAAHAPFIAAP